MLLIFLLLIAFDYFRNSHAVNHRAAESFAVLLNPLVVNSHDNKFHVANSNAANFYPANTNPGNSNADNCHAANAHVANSHAAESHVANCQDT